MSIFFVFFLSGISLNTPTVNLKIEVLHLDSDKGNLHVAIYRKQDSFPEKKHAFKGKIQNANNTLIIFENLPKDNYAVAVFHDENNNGKLDKSFLGYPTEKYGFSNNARGTFGSPGFQEASVTINSDRKIMIALNY